MQLTPRHLSFRGSFPLLGICGLVAGLTLPVRAQETGSPRIPSGFTALSDVSGPFLGNVEEGTSRTGSPTSISVTVTSLDTAARDIIMAPPQLNLGDVLKICLHTTSTLDKMSPFSGCSTVNWKLYNRAVRDTKELRRALSASVAEQKVALKANPSPEQRALIFQKLALLEKTTTSLESTTATLASLGDAMDKAR